MYTREQWARSLLASIGNPGPTQNVVNFVMAWTILETAPPGAPYNLLNTKHQLGIPGTSSDFNTGGVQSFTHYNYGIIANRNALADGFYPDLLLALQNNDETALGFSSGTPDSAILSELSTWCGGCGYGTRLLGLISDPRMNDTFAGNTEPVVVMRV